MTQYFGRLRARVGLEHLNFHGLRKFMETYGQNLGFSPVQVAMRAGRSHSHQLLAQVRRPEDGRRSVRGHTEQRVDRRLRPRRRQRRVGRDKRPRLAFSAMMRVGEV